MKRGNHYRWAQPYTASLNWVGDSKLANRWHMGVSFEHIGRSVTLGPFATNGRSIDFGNLRFEWDFVAFSDVGERFHVFLDIQLRGHGPDSDIGVAIVDSGANKGLWVMDGHKIEVQWEFGNRLAGPWAFNGDETVYTDKFLIATLLPLLRKEEL